MFYSIDNYYHIDDIGFLEVKVTGWDDVKKLPKGILFEEKEYGYSAWDSDRMVAYYRTDKPVGKAIK